MSTAVLVTSIAVFALLVGEARGPRWLPWIAKPCASLGFVAAAWSVGPHDAAGWTVLVGLWLCLVGDVCLLSRAKGWFLAGLGAFFAGHVAYAAAFVQRGVHVPIALVVAIALALPAIVVWRWLRAHVEPAMRGAVAAYIVAITLMVACAIASAGPRAEWLPIVGAVAFYLSDLSVARDVFVHRSFVNRLWGLPLYYAAQLCLAATV
ncbi:MAG TPA: lysoplasmalogenase [Nannocystaceae bacterium]|nr:lysoplasmalogenase [Nannocystaceae bacterium]